MTSPAKVTPGVPKKNRPPREGARRESVQIGLAAAAAKLADVPVSGLFVWIFCQYNQRPEIKLIDL